MVKDYHIEAYGISNVPNKSVVKNSLGHIVKVEFSSELRKAG